MSPVNHRMPSSPKSPRKKLQSMAIMNNIGQQQQQQLESEQLNKQQQHKISLFSSDSAASVSIISIKFQALLILKFKKTHSK